MEAGTTAWLGIPNPDSTRRAAPGKPNQHALFSIVKPRLVSPPPPQRPPKQLAPATLRVLHTLARGAAPLLKEAAAQVGR